MTVRYDFGAGGFDVSFTLPVLESGQYIRIQCDSAFVEDQKDTPDVHGYIKIERSYTDIKISILDNALKVIECFVSDYINYAVQNKMRVTVHNEFISVYCNGAWVNTFWLRYVRHLEEPTVYIQGSSAVTLLNVLYPELNDWRDAIYIDLEQTGMNAVSSVILSKPIDVWHRYSGVVCFAMNPPEQRYDLVYVRKIDQSDERQSLASSDGIVYFTDVAVIVDPEHLAQYGFSTKLFRLPDLDQGIRAGMRLQKNAREAQRAREIVARFDPRVEFKDIVTAEMDMSDTYGRVESVTIAADGIRISMQEGANSMTLSGRKKT